MSQLLAAVAGDGALALRDDFIEAMRAILRDPALDPASRSWC